MDADLNTGLFLVSVIGVLLAWNAYRHKDDS
jgi:hypothetical protein